MRANRLRSLPGDRRAVVSVYFAVTMTAISLMMLAALDLLRVGLLRSQVQTALDAAVLAAGYNLAAPEAEWKADATAYFNANMANGYLGSTVATPTIAVTTNAATGMHVTMSASVTVPLMVTAFTNAGAMTLSLTTGARKRTRANVEMVLAIDNTGSMADDGKMDAAQTAAKQVVATMLGTNSGGNTYLGLVPFNETVRVGRNANTLKWLVNEAGYDTSKWDGCLFERTDAGGNFAIERNAPSANKFRAYRDATYWEYGKKKKHGGTTACWPGDDNCDYIGPNYQELSSQSGCVTAPVNFLTSVRGTLDAAIDSMDAGGSTMVAAGVMWGWRMLSPSWRGTWEANSTLPKDNGYGLNKALVLLTDGDNEVAGSSLSWDAKYYFRSPYGNARATKPWGDLTGKNNTSADDLLWNNNQAAGTLPLTSYCDAVKAEGITIYTIPFGKGGNISTNTARILKGCATDADKYFRVTDGTDLNAAFKTITDSLSELVIEQ